MSYRIHYPIKPKLKTTLKIFRGGADDSMCPICLEDFEESEINNNETIRCESCFQHFHYDCIKHWCESSNQWDSIQNSVCPICRQSNICRNRNFVRRESEASRIRRGIRENQMQTPSEISDIILSIGSEYRIRDNVGLTDLMYLDENWKFNRLNSENENERNENMTNWVSDHLDKFINDMNNSAPNPESQWDIADNREENARTFREEVQRATFNRTLPVWFIAPRPEDSLDIQHLRDLHQLKMFTYSEYNRLKRDYPVYSYFELLFSAEKRKINNERRVAKRKLMRISLRIFLYTMILVKKDTVSRGLTVHPMDTVGDSSESEYESESESETISTQTISTQAQTQTESETGSQTQEDTPVPEPDDGEVAEPQEDTPVPEPDDGEVAEPQEDTPVPEPDNGEVAEPQEGEENVVENDARFDWIPVEENPVEASAVEEAPMARNEEERPRARGWRLPSLSRRRRNAYHPGRPSSSFGMSEPSTETHVDIVGGAGDLPNDRKELKEMCAKAGIPYSSKEGIERIKKRLRALPPSPELKEMCAKAGIPYSSKDGIGRLKRRRTGLPTPGRQHRCAYADRGATYSFFPKFLHKLLTNQEYSNIISWKNDNDGNVLIVLKDKLLVAKELCPRANDGGAVMRSQFWNYGFNRISGRGDNEWVFSNPKVKSIDDILTLRSLKDSPEDRRARRDAEADARNARLAVQRAVDDQRIVNSPTIDDRDRDIANVLMQLNNQSPQSTDMAAMAVPRHVLLEHDEQGDMHSVGEESADMADMAAPRHVLLELDEQGDLHSVGEESADMDNNEAANVFASITNINDENTEDLDRRTSYLQNLNTNNEHSLKIALLIESLKNHVIDENEKNQIKQKQNELWQSLKEIELDNTKRKDILYKYMFEYLKRTIPQAKLNEGAKIAQSNFESIKRAQIHNRPTKPLTESEQKQADEETNAAISRGQMLAQDEDTNMEDVQSPNTQLEPPSAEALKLREEVAQLIQENEQLKARKASKLREEVAMLIQENEQLKASKTPDPAVGEADGEEPVEFTEESLRRSIAEHDKLRAALEAAGEEADGEEPLEFTEESLRRSIAEHDKWKATIEWAVAVSEADAADPAFARARARLVDRDREDREASLPSSSSLAPNTQLEPHSGEAPKPKRRQLGVVPPPGTRVSVRYQHAPDDWNYEGTVGEPLDGIARAMVEFDDGSERPIDFAVPGISITREASQSGGAKQADFLINLHKLLTNQEYSNIISWTYGNYGNILILLKDKLLVAKEVCPRSANIDFHSCARQFCNYGFKTETRLSIEGIDKNNGLIFSNPKVKSIDDILTLERKISTKCRKSPTIDDGDRAANVLAQLNNPSPQSTDMDNNEAANVLASIANISDENTEDLDRRTAYIQNLNTNIEDSIKISLLIEALKQHVVDENEKKQIKQKQNELWQGLKEIPLEDEQRKGVLFKYMGDYLTRTISLSKLKEGAKIVNKKYESIKRAQIHNRPTEPLTESEQKQADEEMNAAISRGSQLAQDEDTNMEDVQSPITPIVEEPWWRKGGITDKALIRLHSEPVDGHMIEVYYGDHWKLGRAVRKKRRDVAISYRGNHPVSGDPIDGDDETETIRQIVTQVDYIDGTSVDELLHRGDWKQRGDPVGQKEYQSTPKYWRYA